MELGQDPVSFYAFLIGIQSLPLEDVSMETLDNWEKSLGGFAFGLNATYRSNAVGPLASEQETAAL